MDEPDEFIVDKSTEEDANLTKKARTLKTLSIYILGLTNSMSFAQAGFISFLGCWFHGMAFDVFDRSYGNSS